MEDRGLYQQHAPHPGQARPPFPGTQGPGPRTMAMDPRYAASQAGNPQSGFGYPTGQAPQAPPQQPSQRSKAPSALTRFFRKPSTQAFLRRNRHSLWATLIGLIIASLFLSIGFFPTLLILIFVILGYSIGSYFDRKPWVFILLEYLQRY